MKNLDNLKITTYETSIAALPDRIENRADWLKKQFDGRTNNEVKKQHNALVDEVARLEDDTYPKGNVYTKGEIDAQKAEFSAGIAAADSKAQMAQDDLNGFKARRDNPHKVTEAQTGAYTKEEVNEQNTALSARITAADSKAQAAQEDLDRYKVRQDNPHMVTAAQTGAYTKAETDSAIDQKITELGAGDMAKAVYDKNNNGVVDNAERLDGKLPSFYAKQEDAVATAALLEEVKKTADEALPKTGKAVDSEKLAGVLPSELSVNMDLLWETAKPTSEFAAQIIAIKTLSNYKLLLVSAARSSQTSNQITAVVRMGQRGMQDIVYPSRGALVWRGVTVTENGLRFDDAYLALKYLDSSFKVFNNNIIPQKIFGIK